jgi:hypothetical protein
VRRETLGVPRGDVALQLPRDGRAERGRDARLRVLQERQYRRRALEGVACPSPSPRSDGVDVKKNAVS